MLKRSFTLCKKVDRRVARVDKNLTFCDLTLRRRSRGEGSSCSDNKQSSCIRFGTAGCTNDDVLHFVTVQDQAKVDIKLR